MKKKDIYQLYNGLQTIRGLEGVKFNYAINRNISLTKPEVEAIQAASNPSEIFIAFENERVALAQKHAKKNEDGSPKTVGSKYEVEDQAAFDAEFAALKETHKEAVAQREQQIKDVEKLLEEESTIELHKISMEEIPEKITTEQMSVIFPLITENK